MNDYYSAHWHLVRTIEGAALRVQEDTMRFSSTAEDLGVSFVNSVLTLIAFLPVLMHLSVNVRELPLLGHVPNALMTVAILWSLAGTLFLAAIGVKLPGLQFRNQRVEPALRKELVYGEDDPDRASPPTLHELFQNVRRNYFRLYFYYMYFNIGRIVYLQVDNIFPYIVFGPSIVAGAIALGLMNRFSMRSTRFAHHSSIWSIPGPRSSSFCRSTNVCALLRPSSMAVRCQRLSWS